MATSPFRRLLFGQPIPTDKQDHSRLPKIIALPVFASDAISSVAYATQEILLVLGAAGLWALNQRDLYTKLTLGITSGIVLLLIIVALSYWQTIFAYPSGGGSYIVSKDNLGQKAGMVAASALLIDYVLTVSVSIASGVQNLLDTPIASILHLEGKTVAISVLFVTLLALANLRGLKESGALFAIPTYLFVGMAMVMIGLGIFGPAIGWTLNTDQLPSELPAQAFKAAHSLAPLALISIILHAFASGCAAMTGTEAVSNGIPAFRKPESRNAALTLLAMACILAVLFLGISALAMKLHIVYGHWGHDSSPAVIDQISTAVFGKTGVPGYRVALYYAMQGTTVAILVLAANTAFADFPRLAALLAKDGLLPRRLGNLGDRLVFTDGIILLSTAAAALLIAFKGSVDKLIPLYAVGVFTAFTLSQSGMVLHWVREKGKGWHVKTAINGIGALATGVVLTVICVEKFSEGAWVVVVVCAIIILGFSRILNHFNDVRSRLTLVGYTGQAVDRHHTVLVLIPGMHRGSTEALRYAMAISADVRAIHVEVEPTDTPKLIERWEQFVGEDIPLVVLPSPYRSLVSPIRAYLDQVARERDHHLVTVVVPEFVSQKKWHSLLHNGSAALLKMYLTNRRDVVLTNVRYYIDSADPVPLAQAPVVGHAKQPS